MAEAWQRRARRDRGVGEACEAWVRHGSLSAAQKTCPLVACRGLVLQTAGCRGLRRGTRGLCELVATKGRGLKAVEDACARSNRGVGALKFLRSNAEVPRVEVAGPWPGPARLQVRALEGVRTDSGAEGPTPFYRRLRRSPPRHVAR